MRVRTSLFGAIIGAYYCIFINASSEMNSTDDFCPSLGDFVSASSTQVAPDHLLPLHVIKDYNFDINEIEWNQLEPSELEWVMSHVNRPIYITPENDHLLTSELIDFAARKDGLLWKAITLHSSCKNWTPNCANITNSYVINNNVPNVFEAIRKGELVDDSTIRIFLEYRLLCFGIIEQPLVPSMERINFDINTIPWHYLSPDRLCQFLISLSPLPLIINDENDRFLTPELIYEAIRGRGWTFMHCSKNATNVPNYITMMVSVIIHCLKTGDSLPEANIWTLLTSVVEHNDLIISARNELELRMSTYYPSRQDVLGYKSLDAHVLTVESKSMVYFFSGIHERFQQIIYLGPRKAGRFISMVYSAWMKYRPQSLSCLFGHDLPLIWDPFALFMGEDAELENQMMKSTFFTAIMTVKIIHVSKRETFKNYLEMHLEKTDLIVPEVLKELDLESLIFEEFYGRNELAFCAAKHLISKNAFGKNLNGLQKLTMLLKPCYDLDGNLSFSQSIKVPLIVGRILKNLLDMKPLPDTFNIRIIIRYLLLSKSMRPSTVYEILFKISTNDHMDAVYISDDLDAVYYLTSLLHQDDEYALTFWMAKGLFNQKSISADYILAVFHDRLEQLASVAKQIFEEESSKNSPKSLAQEDTMLALEILSAEAEVVVYNESSLSMFLPSKKRNIEIRTPTLITEISFEHVNEPNSFTILDASLASEYSSTLAAMIEDGFVSINESIPIIFERQLFTILIRYMNAIRNNESVDWMVEMEDLSAELLGELLEIIDYFDIIVPQ